jgi:two-component system sensor histidine kinase PilS (NtrC family)
MALAGNREGAAVTADTPHIIAEHKPVQTIFGSRILGDRGPTLATVEHWKSLYYFNLYRLVLAVFFITVALSGARVGSLGIHSPRLFLIAAILYGLLGLVTLATINHGRPDYRVQAAVQITADLVLLTLMMHASAGVQSGLGLLMMVVVAAAGVVLGGRMMIFFAALATVAALSDNLVTLFVEHINRKDTPQIGILGIGLFATAFLFYGVTKRFIQTEELAERRGIDLVNLTEINQLIIDRMHSGVLAVAADGRVRLINDRARRMLGLSSRVSPRPPLHSLTPELSARFIDWRHQPRQPAAAFNVPATGLTVVPRFMALGEDGDTGALIFIDDSTEMVRQAQQLKLAALGRLTASIAHEVRNPLGAISHAGQLLAESSALTAEEDRKLVGIIGDQCRRVNSLVEGVMQLGRRDRLHRRVIAMGPWLREFASHFTETQGLDQGALSVEGPAMSVCMDPDQLHQIVFNLCANAMLHGRADSGGPVVRLRTASRADGSESSLDVIDHGPGIPAEAADKIFEPFFTTNARGTGLGLYIARELCEGNNGRLDYHEAEGGGSRFRITFAEAADCSGGGA